MPADVYRVIELEEENARLKKILVRLVDALGALTDPEESFESSINPGPERDELTEAYRDALIEVVHG